MESNNKDQKIDAGRGHDHMKMMGLCLLLAVGAIWIFGVSSEYLFYLIILLCLLMHVMMMGGHENTEEGHQH